jgi:uncharacterized membrane protein (DUF106 family)
MTEIKATGNGTLIIPKWFLIVIALIFTIIGGAVSVAANYTTLRNDVNSLQEDMAVIDDFQEKIDDIQLSCVRSDERLKSIANQVNEIKEILKEERS